ncbi:hypothetical protein [Nitrospira sp. M1]
MNNLKETYQEKIDQTIQEWAAQLEAYSTKLEHLKVKAEGLERSAKIEYLEKLKDLENRIASAYEKLEESRKKYEQLMEVSDGAWDDIKSGGQMAWDDLKSGIESAWDDFKIAFDSASEKFSEKNDDK